MATTPSSSSTPETLSPPRGGGQGAERAATVAGVGLAAASCGLYTAGALQDTEGWSAAALAIGVVAGPLLYGALADRCGPVRALRGAAGLLLAGAAGCAAAAALAARAPAALVPLHFVLGLGAASELPVAAAYVAEAVATSGDSASRTLGRIYQCLLFGALLAAAIDAASALLPSAGPPAACAAFSASAVLSAVAFVLRCRSAQDPPAMDPADGSQGGFQLLCRCPRPLVRTLAGTSLSCLLAGLALSGLSPRLVLSGGGSRLAAALAALLGMLLAVPAFAAVFLRRTRRLCQILAFATTAAGFAGLAGAAALRQPELGIVASFVLHAVTAAFLAPSVYIVPAEVFPTCVRAACLGVSLSLGLAGWALGTAALPLIDEPVAAPLACALAACAGAAGTWLLTPSYDPRLIRDVAPLRPGKSVRESTLEALERGGSFRSCPKCDVMVERDGGCNLITCANCSDVWCFVCGGKSCSAWACSALESVGPDLASLPQLLWPPRTPREDRAAPLVENCDS